MKRQYADVEIKILTFTQDVVTASNVDDDDPNTDDKYPLFG